MYASLLYKQGGGVFAPRTLVPQEDCASIHIGLGGTGISCLRRLKREVCTTLRPDNPDELIPTYSRIRFLAVDSDRDELHDRFESPSLYDLDESTEFFDLSSPNIPALLHQPSVLASDPKFAWFHTGNSETGEPGISFHPSTGGTGGIRQIGRLLLIGRSEAFLQRIDRLIHEAICALSAGGELQIHIYTGTGGGTGSGIFLDVCYMVQQALQGLGIDASVFGYCFLPDVIMSPTDRMRFPSVYDYIMANSCAFLKELDHCMRFDENHDQWDQEYDGFHITTQAPPVHVCYPISARDMNGRLLSREGAVESVCSIVIQTILGNLDSTVGVHAASDGCFVTLGAASARIPMREIYTYLSGKLFEGMRHADEQLPSDNQIREFAAENGLTFDSLYKRLIQGTSDQPSVLELDYHDFRDLPETDLAIPNEIFLPPVIRDHYRTMEEQMINQIEANKRGLLDWNPPCSDGKRTGSLLRHLYDNLAEVVCDPARGPFYAAELLRGAGRYNLVERLRGILAETQSERDCTMQNVMLRIYTVKDARKAFLHPKLLQPKARLFADFLTAVQQLESTTSRLHALEEMESMVHGMIEQFEKLYGTCFRPYSQITKTLMHTFYENAQVLSGMTPAKPGGDPVPLIPFAELRQDLDQTAAGMDSDAVTARFHQKLFPDREIWLDNDEWKLAGFVRSFFPSQFPDWTGRTMTDYLQLHFQTTNAMLPSLINQCLLDPLYRHAEPMLGLTNAFDSAPTLDLCLFPDADDPVRNAALSFAQRHPAMCCIPRCPDRICMIRFCPGVPLSACLQMPEMAEHYRKHPVPGRHLYEGAPGDPRDWRNLPDPE